MRPFFFLFLLAAFAAPLRADEVPAHWIDKLAHGNFKEREKACKALEALGELAVVPLRELIRTGDLEARRRAEGILRKIVAHRMRRSLTQPREVHFRFDKTPIAEVERELQRVLGDVVLSPANQQQEKIVSADTGKRPLWQAMDELSRQTKLSFAPHHAAIADPPAVDPISFLTPYRQWTIDTRPTQRHVRWADRTGAILFLARQPKAEHIDVLAVPDPRLHAVRGISLMRLTRWRDHAGNYVTLPESLLQSEFAQEPKENRVSDAADSSSPPSIYRALFTAKAPLDFDAIEGVALCEVRSLDDVFTISDLVKAEGKPLREPKTGVGVTLHEVDFQSDTELRLKVAVRDFERYLRLPDTPEVIRLKPGVLAVRGPADYVAESLHIVDGRGATFTGRLLEQPRLEKDGLHLWLQFAIPPRSRPQLSFLVANSRLDVIELPFTLHSTR